MPQGGYSLEEETIYNIVEGDVLKPIRESPREVTQLL
jgi:hypothetical protein